MGFLAKKRRRGARSKKVQTQVGGKKNIVLHKTTSERVIVPDIIYLFKRKHKKNNEVFVGESCIQEQVSLALVSGNSYNVKKENSTGWRKGNRRRYLSTTPFVPLSCLTNSVSPVVRFWLVKKELQDKTLLSVQRRAKKVRKSQNAEFVPLSCITDKPSVAYKNKAKFSRPQFYSQDKHYEIVFDTIYKRRKKLPSEDFVPKSCITSLISLVYKFNPEPKPLQFVNPYPDLPMLTPDIVGGLKVARPRPKNNSSFVPDSCVTDTISTSYVKPEEKPRIKYIYVDRPNSPDIVGLPAKKSKRKKNNVIPFVPKSCTVEPEKVTAKEMLPLQSGEALARTAPETLSQEKTGTNLLALVGLILVLLAFVWYLVQK